MEGMQCSPTGRVGGVLDERSKVAAVNDAFTQKERLLLEQIRQTFQELGPEAFQLMELIVTKGTTFPKESGTAALISASERGGEMGSGSGSGSGVGSGVGGAVPSLRAIERFFLRLSDSEVAFWRVHPTRPDDLIVPKEVCDNDPYFRNDHHVVPVHVFASLKRMAAQWQKRYVDNFGRRTKALNFPFPTTICQANCFGWLFSEQILHRLTLLSANSPSGNLLLSVKRPSPNVVPTAEKRQKLENGYQKSTFRPDEESSVGPTRINKSGAKRPKELYLFNYPRYVPRPPIEGAGPDDPLSPLPLLASSSEVVERYYTSLVDRVLYHNRLINTDIGTVKIVGALPLLCPDNPTVLPSLSTRHPQKRSTLSKPVVSHQEQQQQQQLPVWFERGTGLPAFLFEVPPDHLVPPEESALPIMLMDQHEAKTNNYTNNTNNNNSNNTNNTNNSNNSNNSNNGNNRSNNNKKTAPDKGRRGMAERLRAGAADITLDAASADQELLSERPDTSFSPSSDDDEDHDASDPQDE